MAKRSENFYQRWERRRQEMGVPNTVQYGPRREPNPTRKYANVVMTVEIMIPIHEHEAETEVISEHRAKVEVTRAIKDGLWFHVTSPRIVHIAEEK